MAEHWKGKPAPDQPTDSPQHTKKIEPDYQQWYDELVEKLSKVLPKE